MKSKSKKRRVKKLPPQSAVSKLVDHIIMIFSFLFTPGFPPKSSDFIAYGRDIVTSMTGNVNFPTPDPTLAAVTAALDAAQLAIQKYAIGQITKDARDLKIKAAEDMVMNLIRYAEYTAGGDMEKATSTLIKMRKAPIAHPIPAMPATVGGKSVAQGRVDLKWVKVQFAATYMIEMSSDNGQTWQFVDAVGRTTYTINGLNSVKMYLFRVKACNAAGESGWSDPALVVVI